MNKMDELRRNELAKKLVGNAPVALLQTLVEEGVTLESMVEDLIGMAEDLDRIENQRRIISPSITMMVIAQNSPKKAAKRPQERVSRKG
jgi:hypothetical protein